MSATAIPAKLLHQEKLTAAAKDQCVTLERQVAVQKERLESLEARCAELLASKSEADAARGRAEEALAVSVAERKLVDDTIGRADALVGELRAERAALLTRATDAEAQLKDAQERRVAVEESRVKVQESLSVEKIERRAAKARRSSTRSSRNTSPSARRSRAPRRA